MEKFGPRVTLQAFRRDALHRNAMCGALAAVDPAYLPIGEAAAATMAAIDAKSVEVRRGEDLLVQTRAVERASKLRAATLYDQLRRDLAAEAVRLVQVLLPVPPSALKKAGMGRARAMVEQAVENLRRPEMPDAVRTEHLPLLEGHLARMNEADRTEDLAVVSFTALRAALALFKADREVERVRQYADLLQVAGNRAAADEFFLSARSSRADAGDDDDEPTEPTPPTDAPAPPTPPTDVPTP